MPSDDQQNEAQSSAKAVQPAKVGLDEIRAHMATYWKNTACHKCGVDNWLVGSESDVAVVLPVGLQTDTSIFSTRKILPSIWLMCRNCGFVELLSMNHVAALTEAGKAKK
jgi:predicted nucleic-acid-binding Zn-ribbon protein